MFFPTVPIYMSSYNLIQSLDVWMDLYKIQSSANKCTMLFFMLSGRLFIKIKKVQALILSLEEHQLLQIHLMKWHYLLCTSLWVLLAKNDEIQVWMFPLMPYQSSLYKSLLWDTVSNALAKSSEIRFSYLYAFVKVLCQIIQQWYQLSFTRFSYFHGNHVVAHTVCYSLLSDALRTYVGG